MIFLGHRLYKHIALLVMDYEDVLLRKNARELQIKIRMMKDNTFNIYKDRLVEINKILTNSRKILKKAIEAGGTTLNDYFNADSKPGYFKIKLNVYDCEGQNCKNCKTKIKRIVQSNRSTYFCPICQKI